MNYEVYRQISRPFPKVGEWKFICYTESDKPPGEYDWNCIVRALTNETVSMQSDKGIWWQVRARWHDLQSI